MRSKFPNLILLPLVGETGSTTHTMSLVGFEACICLMNDVRQGRGVDENCKDKSQRGPNAAARRRWRPQYGHDNIGGGFNFPRDLPARKCTTSERQGGGEPRVRLPEQILEDFSNSDRVVEELS